MGLDVNLYEIVNYNEDLIELPDYYLYNLDQYTFNGMDDIIMEKQFIFAEDRYDFSPIPIGSKLLNDTDEYGVFNYIFKGVRYKIKPNIIKSYGVFILAKQIKSLRKGANSQFYRDGMWDGTPICLLNTLKEHHKKYFSGQKGGKQARLLWKNTVEYLDMSNKELSKRFKETILDNFIEGKTFVAYV